MRKCGSHQWTGNSRSEFSSFDQEARTACSGVRLRDVYATCTRCAFSEAPGTDSDQFTVVEWVIFDDGAHRLRSSLGAGRPDDRCEDDTRDDCQQCHTETGSLEADNRAPCG